MTARTTRFSLSLFSLLVLGAGCSSNSDSARPTSATATAAAVDKSSVEPVGETTATGSAEAAPAEDESGKLDVMVLAPFSGEEKFWGENFRAGVEMALELATPEERARMNVRYDDTRNEREKTLELVDKHCAPGGVDVILLLDDVPIPEITDHVAKGACTVLDMYGWYYEPAFYAERTDKTLNAKNRPTPHPRLVWFTSLKGWDTLSIGYESRLLKGHVVVLLDERLVDVRPNLEWALENLAMKIPHDDFPVSKERRVRVTGWDILVVPSDSSAGEIERIFAELRRTRPRLEPATINCAFFLGGPRWDEVIGELSAPGGPCPSGLPREMKTSVKYPEAARELAKIAEERGFLLGPVSFAYDMISALSRIPTAVTDAEAIAIEIRSFPWSEESNLLIRRSKSLR